MMPSDMSVSTMSVTHDRGVALLEFCGGHKANPFSQDRMRELRCTLTELDASDDVRAVVLYGGENRWFAVGGDFNELNSFTGGPEVTALMAEIGEVFIAAISMTTPLIAAIDGWAIGFGLELALTSDYRVASSTARLKMPEFKLGIACTFGGYMLEHVVGRSTMQSMLFSTDTWDAHRALSAGLVHEVVPADRLRNHARDIAGRVATFNPVPVQETKPFLNAAYLNGLHEVVEVSKRAHVASFSAGTAQKNMRAVLGKKV